MGDQGPQNASGRDGNAAAAPGRAPGGAGTGEDANASGGGVKMKEVSEDYQWKTKHGVKLNFPTPGRPKYYRLDYRTRTGQRLQPSAGADFDAAWALALEKDRELELSVLPESGRTVGELRDAFLVDVSPDWSPRHAEDTADTLTAALADIADLPCWELTRDDVTAAINGAPSESGKRKNKAAVGRMLTWGYDEDYLTLPRSAFIKRKSRTAKRDHGREHGESIVFIDPKLRPSADECRLLAESMFTVGGDKLGEQAWLMVAVAASCGLRFGELTDLRVKSLRFAAGELRVVSQVVWVKGANPRQTPPKWGRRRTTVLPVNTIWGEPLRERLRAFVAGKGPEDIVFAAPRGAWWNPSNCRTRLLTPAKLAEEQWDSDWAWHSLRHAFCSHLLDAWPEESDAAGVVVRVEKKAASVADVSQAAGHRDPHVTMSMYVSATKGATGRLNAVMG